MRFLGKLILTVASTWLVLSLYAIFWPSAPAVIVEKSNFSLSQNGYNGVSKFGVSNFKGSNTVFNFASYHYTVKEKTYKGYGNIGLNSDNTVTVYYCPIYPAFSLTNNTIPLPWLFLLYILGFGFLEINKWLRGFQKQRQP
ncbi:hypothetical protein D0C16_01205 [Cellvibrio sp. KY-GH-1]|uniref:hypothetical protein n=1 Tax=Cellvibrio sp. KY-GH-1 TaxID=2303332 RepID=UPI0012451D26|nr:hypothetical protein [Cellvibrio sp. KY-GH-1]QEY14711.1 hypothetical protein D0C16_01205 [Cellvibrio sp. KY-GH-1]